MSISMPKLQFREHASISLTEKEVREIIEEHVRSKYGDAIKDHSMSVYIAGLVYDHKPETNIIEIRLERDL